MSVAYPAPRPDADPIRVMIVDDAVVVRGLVSRWLGEEQGITVVASHRSARDAVADIDRTRPDVVILDIEMPDLDGISALPLMLEKKRDLVVIMASTLTRRNAEISLRALSLGAADYIPKPESNREVTTSASFRRELVDKVKHLGRRRRPGAPLPGAASPAARGATGTASLAPRPTPAAPSRPAATLRPFSQVPPRVLLVGASTGGPQALAALVKGIGPVIDKAPVLIVQHMPATFTTILAEHLARASGRPAREPQHGDPVQPGTIYVAPGGRHMVVEKRGPLASIALTDGPPVNFCKPAVDPMFASAAPIWGAASLALVLTGMGADGAQGARVVASAGGSVIAQDEATSVVWGMPGATAQAGVCSAILPLPDIAARIVRVFSGDRA